MLSQGREDAGPLSGKTFALWGLAFKPNTDDMREAPSRSIAGELETTVRPEPGFPIILSKDRLRQAQPKRDESSIRTGRGLVIAGSAAEALQGADALAIVTEWKEFRTPDFEAIRAALRTLVVFDGRNLYEPSVMAAFGLEYHCIGRAAVMPRP